MRTRDEADGPSVLKAVNLVEKLAVVVVMEVERLAMAAEDRKVIMGG